MCARLPVRGEQVHTSAGPTSSKPVELRAKVGSVNKLEDRPAGSEQVSEECSDDMRDRFVQKLDKNKNKSDVF